jgi:signal transduction histidine kinase
MKKCLQKKVESKKDLQVLKLEKQLSTSKRKLQSVIKEHQEAVEEIATANEELIAINDELLESSRGISFINNDLINLLNNVEIPILIFDINRRLRRYTPQAKTMMNLFLTDIGRKINEIKPDVQSTVLDQLIAEVIKAETVKELEVQDKWKRWYRIQIRPYKTVDTEIGGAILTYIDINYLKREMGKAEWALDYAKSIVEGLRTPLLVLDKKMRIKSANKALYTMFGVSQVELENKTLSELGISQWSIPSLDTTLGDMLEQNVFFQNIELDHSFPNLGMRTISISSQPIHFQIEMTDMILLSLKDISPRKMIDRELANERRKLEIIFHEAPASMTMWKGTNHIFEMVNPAYQAVFPGRDLLGKPFMEALNELEGQGFDKYLDAVLESGVPFIGRESVAKLAVGKDGSLEDHYFDFTCQRIMDAEGKPYGVFAHSVDVTDRVRARQELEETVRELAEERVLRESFVATLTHDLRGPLTIAKVCAEVLMRNPRDVHQLKKFETIVRNMDRLDNMIRGLLDVTRIKSGEKVLLNISECNLNEITRAIIEEQISVHGDRFILKADKNIIGFWDCASIQRMIENLLGNAIKYGTPQCPITVQLVDVNKIVKISVHNEGQPIPADEQILLFEKFRRSSSATKSLQKGWGIGLTLVRGLAEAHGGQVNVRSELNEGTTFTISIPKDSKGL